MQYIQINGSREANDGITVWFEEGEDRDFYHAHGITEVGEKEDDAGHLKSMWGWINHMRSKVWWNNDLESAFKREVSKYLEI